MPLLGESLPAEGEERRIKVSIPMRGREVDCSLALSPSTYGTAGEEGVAVACETHHPLPWVSAPLIFARSGKLASLGQQLADDSVFS
jgi:hypothetical protein